MIRKPLPTDIDAINKLGSLLDGKFSDKNDISNYIINDMYVIYVACDSDEVIGFIMLTSLYETMELLYIVVQPTYQHTGYGTKLLEEVIKNKTKATRILLEVRADNKKAIDFYTKNQFQTINIRKNYYDNNTDAIIMERSI